LDSEAVEYYDREGHQVIGVDNNMWAEFFGSPGDTTWNLSRLQEISRNFQHHHLDIRDRRSLLVIYKGKQMRDNIHSFDVIQCFEAFRRDPRPEEVYNLGGGERITSLSKSL
jgi:CDP-paratose 2-epimerase